MAEYYPTAETGIFVYSCILVHNEDSHFCLFVSSDDGQILSGLCLLAVVTHSVVNIGVQRFD